MQYIVVTFAAPVLQSETHERVVRLSIGLVKPVQDAMQAWVVKFTNIDVQLTTH